MTASPLDVPNDIVLGPVMASLNPADVLTACREQLDGVPAAERRGWRAARIHEALYHPGRYVRVAYALLNDQATSERRTWPEADIVYVHAPVRQPVSRRGTTIKLGGADCELYRFPNDRRLRGLRKFANRKAAVETWTRWIESSEQDVQLKASSLQRLLLRYVPEQKWVVRLRAEPVHAGRGKVHKQRITVRSAAPDVCAELHRRYTALRRYYKEAKPCFHAVRVVGLDSDLGLLAVKWAHGDDLLTVLRDGDSDGKFVLRTVAEIMHAFHNATIEGLPAVTAETLVRAAQESADDLASACPELRETIHGVATRLRERLTDVGAERLVTLHNDLHVKQILFDQKRVTLLDLERMALGDPLIDVANLAAQILMLGHRSDHNVGEPQTRRWMGEFLAQWASVSNERIDAPRLRTYCALSVMNLARGMMRHLRPGWRSLVQSCLTVAESELSASGREVMTS